MLGQSSGGFQPSRQGFNQMPQQQQNFGGFDGGYGMPQQQQNFGGFGGGYNMSQQYTDDGSGYGGGYGMFQQPMQQARQYQQPMQQARQYQQPMQQARQYQQPMQQRFQQQARQYQQPMQQSMLQQSLSNMPQEYTNQPSGSMEDRVSRLTARGLGDFRSQPDGGMDAGMGEYNRVSAGRNMAERAALANQPPASMQDLSSALRSQRSGMSGSGSQPMFGPAPNMSQTFPEDPRMQARRIEMQKMNFNGGRPYTELR